MSLDYVKRDVEDFRKAADVQMQIYRDLREEHELKKCAADATEFDRTTARVMINACKHKIEAIESLMETFEELFGEYAPLPIEQEKAA